MDPALPETTSSSLSPNRPRDFHESPSRTMSNRAASAYLQHLQNLQSHRASPRAVPKLHHRRTPSGNRHPFIQLMPGLPEEPGRRTSAETDVTYVSSSSSGNSRNSKSQTSRPTEETRELESIESRAPRLVWPEDDFGGLHSQYDDDDEEEDDHDGDEEDSFIALIEETQQRWKNSSRVNTNSLTVVESPQAIIQRQQEEIERLRAELESKNLITDGNLHHTIEQIDQIPLELVEIDDDHVSVTSALTNLVESSRIHDDNSVVLEPTHRPDADSVTGAAPPQRVRNFPVVCFAENGSPRKALYSGPLLKSVPTGVGTLKFENGDWYMGEIVNGEMHGQGTYTKRRRSKNSVLRGVFEHNVYSGYETLMSYHDL